MNFGISFNDSEMLISNKIPKKYKKQFQRLKNTFLLKSKSDSFIFEVLSKSPFNEFIENQKKKINLLKKTKIIKSKLKDSFNKTLSISNKISYNLTFNKKKISNLMLLNKPRFSERNKSFFSSDKTKKTFFESSDNSEDIVKTLKQIHTIDSKGFTDSKFRENIRALFKEHSFDNQDLHPFQSISDSKNLHKFLLMNKKSN